MPKTWPVAEFQDYLRACMRAAGISGEAELAELSGVSQNQFSTWRLGRNQPTMANLRRVAPVLGVPAAKLFLAAGLMDEGELDVASGMIDPGTLPVELRELIDMYLHHLTDEQRSYTRRTVAYLTAGLRDEVARSQVKPIKRPRSA